MKRFLCTLVIFCIVNLSASAVDFDSSIDSDIRKNYNLDDPYLPPLPEESDGAEIPQIKPAPSNPIGAVFNLRNGTVINLRSTQAISDRTPKGSKVSFLSTNTITTKEGQVIPAGTVFKGTITDSHPPQISANGGLIEIKIDEIYFNGIMSKIESKVSVADAKKIFLGNIKGKHTYWSNFAKTMTPGTKFFKTTQRISGQMSAIPVVNIVSFVPVVAGTVFYGVNLVSAPFITIFTKGKSINIPSGSGFQIKLTDAVQIKG